MCVRPLGSNSRTVRSEREREERVRGRKRCQNDAECAVNVFDSDNVVRACTSYQPRKLNLACQLDQLISRTRLSEDVCRVPSRVSIVSRDAASRSVRSIRSRYRVARSYSKRFPFFPRPSKRARGFHFSISDRLVYAKVQHEFTEREYL